MNNIPTNQTILSISDLCFAYQIKQSSHIITNLSLKITAGEIVSIVGASGCGKSTLLNLVAGILSPLAGTIDLANNQTDKKEPIGYIFQDDALLPWRTVQSNLTLFTEIIKNISLAAAKERIKKYLPIFHLDTGILKQYPSQLSGGMRQRVSIIQTLMFNPALLLLDEPFSALDFFTKLRLESELYQLIKEQKKGAILITHDLDEAIALADRVLIMAKGGVITNEYKIDFGTKTRSPEDVRGTAQFAEYYNSIWSQLRTVIQA